MSVPVLTYHSLNVHENSYQENDHIAFSTDLRTIDDLGLKIVPLDRVVAWRKGIIPDSAMEGAVAITLDDGSWLDFHNIEHPTCGLQISMINILRQFRNQIGQLRQPELHVSSFVITSPNARIELDVKNLIGEGWWGDDWWAQANATGLMNIECHSWDHNHETLDFIAQREQLKGDFKYINTFEDCDIQVAQSGDYIEKKSGIRPSLFAYPWGEASNYLLNHYMPRFIQRHKFQAAFSTCPKHVTKEDDIWFLPRYVCGQDWKSDEELRRILIP